MKKKEPDHPELPPNCPHFFKCESPAGYALMDGHDKKWIGGLFPRQHKSTKQIIACVAIVYWEMSADEIKIQRARKKSFIRFASEAMGEKVKSPESNKDKISLVRNFWYLFAHHKAFEWKKWGGL